MEQIKDWRFWLGVVIMIFTVFGSTVAGMAWFKQMLLGEVVYMQRENNIYHIELEICSLRSRTEREFKSCVLEYARLRAQRSNRDGVL